ncbi:response regulator [Dyadobacter sp. CY312]|uniref:hybrid sensor histidine kinase/response regulator n=1 Tax=Dyadobacter sp. CY312 TaxID=2907303 RepID=UPI001F3ACB7D|nr:response regulator [Dyadobacter sp. CY312]MCE7043335.1 response regulator [Dyadobacter sp. CY312]
MLTTLANKKFRGPFLSICLGSLLIFGSQYFAYKSVLHLGEHNALLNKTSRILHQTANFGQRAKDLQLNMYSYLNTDNNDLLRDNYLKRVELIEVSDTLFNLMKGDKQQTVRVKELLEISSKIALFSHQIMRLANTDGIEKARAVIRQGEGIRLNSQLMNKIREIDRYENLTLDNRRKLVVSTQKNTTVYIVGTTIAGFLLTLVAFIFMFRDQKKQRRMQEEINKKEVVLKQYVEAIPDGIMVINSEKDIVLLNQSGKEMLGVETGQFDKLETLMQHIALYYPDQTGQTIPADMLPVTRALAGDKTAANKLNIVINGVIKNLESNVSPIYETSGEVASAITVFRDITDRVNYQKTLENARLLAEKSLRVKDVFLSNVSHEIRTPLNAIIGFTNLLEAGEKDVRNLEYVGYIQLASRNLLELINDVLDFSKIEAGHVQLEKTATSLSGLIDSVSVLIGQRAREKGIKYEVYPSDKLPQIVETDHLRLTQILLNVCGNAVKFTEKGVVRLSVEPVSAISNEYQSVRFTIEDTGIGIAQGKIDEIFERFVQASESTTRLFGGTGLGLSIVKSLVDLLGGTIKVSSVPNQGTSFVIECPFRILSEESYEKPETALEISAASLPKLHILIAEDNLLNQKLLRAIFEKLGFEFVIVGNGLEAVELLKQESFDLVIMDLQMPVMDGYTAIRKIRKEISSTVPIITMTAHALVGEKEECLSIGANSYISKPFKQEELISTILHVTGKALVAIDEEQKTNEKKSSPISDTMLNLSYLNEITGGSEELRDELIAMFAGESETQLAHIRNASSSRDAQSLAQAVHKYRSSLFSVGMLTTADKYKAIEASLKKEIWPEDIDEMIPDIEAEALAGLAQLQSLSTPQ